jgi:hypothetical protein
MFGGNFICLWKCMEHRKLQSINTENMKMYDIILIVHEMELDCQLFFSI